MPKSFLVKKRVEVPATEESENLPDAELIREHGKDPISLLFQRQISILYFNDIIF